jgi:hypothetical protein
MESRESVKIENKEELLTFKSKWEKCKIKIWVHYVFVFYL